MTDTKEIAIDAEGLTKSFNGRTVVNHLTRIESWMYYA